MTAGYIGKVSKFYPKTMRRHWGISRLVKGSIAKYEYGSVISC